MLTRYTIDEIDLKRRALRLTCFARGRSGGVQFSVPIPDQAPPYPEGEALDRMIAVCIPRSALLAMAESSPETDPVMDDAPQVPPKRPGTIVHSVGAMTAVTEGNEKIFQLKPLTRTRILDIPVELY